MAAAPAAATESLDLYRQLQVEPNARPEAIHAAYRRLARLYHPDVNTEPGAAKRMRLINAAYAVLSDPQRRAKYDARRFLRPALTVAPAAPVTARPSVTVHVPPVSSPPTRLQRTVDRFVVGLGVLLVLLISFYVVSLVRFGDQAGARHALFVSTPAGSSSASAHNYDAIPERLRQDGILRGFPGPVLVAPEGMAPFVSLPVRRVDAIGRGLARYAVYYGETSVGGATISGQPGRATFDASIPRIAGCAPESDYCAGLAPGQTSGPPGLELFRGADLVADFPAFVTHRICCNGVFWTVAWYEPGPDMTYTIDLARSVAVPFGSTVDRANADTAHQLGALARDLVRLP